MQHAKGQQRKPFGSVSQYLPCRNGFHIWCWHHPYTFFLPGLRLFQPSTALPSGSRGSTVVGQSWQKKAHMRNDRTSVWTTTETRVAMEPNQMCSQISRNLIKKRNWNGNLFFFFLVKVLKKTKQKYKALNTSRKHLSGRKRPYLWALTPIIALFLSVPVNEGYITGSPANGLPVFCRWLHVVAVPISWSPFFTSLTAGLHQLLGRH